MSIRLRLTLLYSLILALTLLVFGTILYTVQAQNTLNSLKNDLSKSGERIGGRILWSYSHPVSQTQEDQPPPPPPNEPFFSDFAFQELREREIVRVLDLNGELIASPGISVQEAFPINHDGLQALLNQKIWWQTGELNGERVLIYNRPLIAEDEVVLILQVARQLTERDRSLASLGTNLFIASLVLIVAAFGIGWIFSGAALKPIDRITQTAQEIGKESDFSRRVDYHGPNDEIGRLAKTFDSMLSRLQDAYQRVSEALNLQRRFVADVSHELRTPLTTVRGNLALLHRQPPPSIEEQTDILKDLEEESDRLIRLVNNLLILARSDADQGQINPQGSLAENHRLDLQEVIAEACRQAQHLDPQREIVLNTQDLQIFTDRDTIKQVLLILLDNAIKYTKGSIRVSLEKEDNQALIAVQDEGPGIDEAALQHVFERFYRGEVPPDVPGFGLGLSIARTLVEALGGTISIESQVEKGSRVEVRLPI